MRFFIFIFWGVLPHYTHTHQTHSTLYTHTQTTSNTPTHLDCDTRWWCALSLFPRGVCCNPVTPPPRHVTLYPVELPTGAYITFLIALVVLVGHVYNVVLHILLCHIPGGIQVVNVWSTWSMCGQQHDGGQQHDRL